MTDEEKPDNLEKPEQIIDDIITRLDAMHSTLVEGATQVGYTRDAFRTIRPMWASLGNASTSNPEAAKIYNSGINFLSTFRDEVRSKESLVKPFSGLSQQLAGSAASFVTATDSTASFVFAPTVYRAPLNPPQFPSPDQQQSYSERFARFDPALGKTYREIWEALYGMCQ